jgi:hypothetical protein
MKKLLDLNQRKKKHFIKKNILLWLYKIWCNEELRRISQGSSIESHLSETYFTNIGLVVYHPSFLPEGGRPKCYYLPDSCFQKKEYGE